MLSLHAINIAAVLLSFSSNDCSYMNCHHRSTRALTDIVTHYCAWCTYHTRHQPINSSYGCCMWATQVSLHAATLDCPVTVTRPLMNTLLLLVIVEVTRSCWFSKGDASQDEKVNCWCEVLIAGAVVLLGHHLSLSQCACFHPVNLWSSPARIRFTKRLLSNTVKDVDESVWTSATDTVTWGFPVAMHVCAAGNSRLLASLAIRTCLAVTTLHTKQNVFCNKQ